MALTKGQRERLRAVEENGTITPADRLALPGLHFCPDWDYMAVFRESPEFRSCTCDPMETGEGE